MVVRSMCMCVRTVRAAGQMCSQLTSARGRSANGNQLSGAVPAALGALTDLELLCARPLERREGPARPALPIGALIRVRCCAAG
jgi:hypothetical protein